MEITKQWTYNDNNGNTTTLILYSNNIAELTIKRGLALSKHKSSYGGSVDMLEYYFKYYITSMMYERLNAKEMLRRLIVLAD